MDNEIVSAFCAYKGAAVQRPSELTCVADRCQCNFQASAVQQVMWIGGKCFSSLAYVPIFLGLQFNIFTHKKVYFCTCVPGPPWSS